jgi:probable HAF family extracellular repeat protein
VNPVNHHSEGPISVKETTRFIAGPLLVFVSILHANGASFQGLGGFPGYPIDSYAYGVSGDGTVVVGSSASRYPEAAFRWTRTTGMQALGNLPGGISSVALEISNDGSVIVGHGGTSLYSVVAFRWTRTGGMTGLGFLPGMVSDPLSQAHAVSRNGGVIVGTSTSGGADQAFRWTATGGMMGLGNLPGQAGGESRAYGVSADGSVIVGQSWAGSRMESFRWTQSEGMMSLGALPAGYYFSGAQDVSSDGSVIIGVNVHTGGKEAYRWTEAGGMVGLGDLPGGYFDSQAADVSSDGSFIVGYSYDDSGQAAMVWDAVHGMRSVKTILQDSGLDVTGWTLWEANGISDDGSVIVGNGINPGGSVEGWIAVIPEPSHFILFSLGAILWLATARVRFPAVAPR